MNDFSATREIEQGTRFAFGDNWSRFLSQLTEDAITAAGASLRYMLGVVDLKGVRFILGAGAHPRHRS